MNYKLFLDDERYPKNPDCMIARNSYDAQTFIDMWGMPVEMMLDHDLGGLDTTMVFLGWLEGYMNEHGLTFPEGFTYSVHSQNPIGAKNIKDRMEYLLEYGG